MIQSLIKRYSEFKTKNSINNSKKQWIMRGQIPWTEGYQYIKEDAIKRSIHSKEILENFNLNNLPDKYGYRLDERIVEYPWIINNLSKTSGKLLDAGSTFNFDFIVDHPMIVSKEMSIYTFYPEERAFYKNRISYPFGDLRNLPFRSDYFEEIVCQSTLEHIDMDNSMYGYGKIDHSDIPQKSYEYLKVISELIRVLQPLGTLLMTFPYGRFENHGFFQQIDKEMLDKIENNLSLEGDFTKTFFKYLPNGWICSKQDDCDRSESYNPHTGKGKGADFAAHSRAICCLKFSKMI